MKLARTSPLYGVTRRVAGALGALLLRALGATWRISTSGEDPFRGGPQPFVTVLWHEGLAVAAFVLRDHDVTVPVSRSRDGDWMDAVLQRLGFAPSARGSSSRGATALLRAMIRRVRGGGVVGVLPDGPRGPARRAKPGAVALAGATGARLVPLGVAAERAWRFGSWDRALLPLPGSRVHVRYGRPFHVPKKAGAAGIEASRKELEAALDQARREAEDALARQSSRS